MNEYKILSKEKTMIEAGEKVFQFVTNDRGWKGCSVLVEIEDENSAKGYHGAVYSKVVKEQLGGYQTDPTAATGLYLCLGHFRTKATARKMVEDLQTGKITIAQAIEKSLKSYEKWVLKAVSGQPHGGSNGIGRNQLIYFGGTKQQVARLDAAEKMFSDYISRMVDEREAKKVG